MRSIKLGLIFSACILHNLACTEVGAQVSSSNLENQPNPIARIDESLGNLQFEGVFFDFGKVVEGEVVKHNFKFRNIGTAPVRIAKLESSCGCTTTNNVLREYAPGEEAVLEAVVDTVGKKGMVVKTVTLTLENNTMPKIEVSMAMNLEPPPHPMRVQLPNMNADERCKGCHLLSGEGQQGIFLYHRVCAQCHGKRGVGASARALNDAQWQRKVKDSYLKMRIEDGWSEKGMPSFVNGVNPPLDTGQVLSLLKYIREMPQPK